MTKPQETILSYEKLIDMVEEHLREESESESSIKNTVSVIRDWMQTFHCLPETIVGNEFYDFEPHLEKFLAKLSQDGKKEAYLRSHTSRITRVNDIFEQRNCGRIVALESIFTQQPDLRQLVPVTYQRQPTARKVIRKGDRDHHVGLFPSRLNQSMVPFESALEKQACTTFESHPEIQAYRSQPFEVRLFYAGKVRPVYPDFELSTTNRKILVDVRHEKKTRKPLFRKRCNALALYAAQRGMGYTLMTEKTIQGERYFNAKWLLCLATGAPRPGLIKAVWKWILDLDRPTFGNLFQQTAAYPQVRCVLACLALDGHLGIDLDQPLRDQSINPSFDLEV
jgi:hypothetical protein